MALVLKNEDGEEFEALIIRVRTPGDKVEVNLEDCLTEQVPDEWGQRHKIDTRWTFLPGQGVWEPGMIMPGEVLD